MNDVLTHHGILGQKWGVRRYQEEDGTLTSLGKKRYLGDASAARNAMEQDKMVLNLRAAYGYGLATGKDAKQSALAQNHPDRYKTARQVYDDLSKETGKLKQYEATLVKNRLDSLKEAGLDKVKGVSIATIRNSTALTDVSISYRYYSDDQEEPTYYPTVQSLKAAIEQKEEEEKKKKKKKEAEKKKKNRQEAQTKMVNDVKNKAKEILDKTKSIPSSVLNKASEVIDNGKSIVDNILKKK